MLLNMQCSLPVVSHASEQPPYISFLNDSHYPMKILVCQKSRSWAMIYIVNNNDANHLQVIWIVLKLLKIHHYLISSIAIVALQ